MLTIDTNVAVRLLVEDDPIQSQCALDLWRTALAAGGVFLPKIVLVETVWVLSFSYRFDRPTIHAAVQRLLDMQGCIAEDEHEIRDALAAFADGNADLADYLILEAAKNVGALPVHTFDRRFAREDKVKLVEPPAGKTG